jgi:hypothetical protein
MSRHEYPSLRQGLIRAWRPSLGASGLTLIDRSGLNAHGTLTNMAGQNNWQASGSGVALNFDGANDYVACGATLTGAFTHSSWFWQRTLGTNTNRVVHGNTGSGNVYLSSIRQTQVAIQGDVPGVRTFAASISLQKWTHICVLRQADSLLSVFIDGVRSTTAPQTLTSVITLNALGRYADAVGGNAPFQWDGYLDDIRIYDRDLTLSEIRLLASRRGIGLQTLPDRAAGMPRKLFVNVGGTWRDGDAYVNVGGAWKLGTPFVNAGGTWK